MKAKIVNNNKKTRKFGLAQKFLVSLGYNELFKLLQKVRTTLE